MNYGFWLLLGQSQQTSLMAGQMRQLGEINSHLAQQQFLQRQQAALTQLLFDVERFNGAMDQCAMRDPFAAGFLSTMRLRSVSSISPEFFLTIEHKRAWVDLCDRLAMKWRAVEQNPASHDLAMRLARASDELARLQAILGPDPEGRLAEVRKKAASESLRRNIALGSLLGFPALAFVSCSVGTDPPVKGHPGSGGLTLGAAALAGLFFLIAFYAGVFFIGKLKDARRARERVGPIEQGIQQWQALQANPEGVPLLERMLAEHPLIRG